MTGGGLGGFAPGEWSDDTVDGGRHRRGRRHRGRPHYAGRPRRDRRRVPASGTTASRRTSGSRPARSWPPRGAGSHRGEVGRGAHHARGGRRLRGDARPIRRQRCTDADRARGARPPRRPGAAGGRGAGGRQPDPRRPARRGLAACCGARRSGSRCRKDGSRSRPVSTCCRSRDDAQWRTWLDDALDVERNRAERCPAHGSGPTGSP